MKIKKNILLIVLLLIASIAYTKENKLYVFNWTEYIDPEIVTEFEEKYDCEVVEDYFDSNESMLTKVANATKSYDLVCPSGDHVQIMLEMGLLAELDKEKLPNWKHLNPSILNKLKDFDDIEPYAMPYFWGVTGILYNPEYVKLDTPFEASWSLFENEEYKNKLMMLDDAREVVGAALIASGYSANNFSSIALSKAEEKLINWDRNISQYHSDAYKNDVPQGEIWIAQAYNGDALQVIREFDNLKFALMQEGGTYWIDSFVLLNNAENKDMAYKFLNFLMEPEIAARNAEWVEYATPNLTAYQEYIDEESKNNKLIYIPESYLNKCYPIKYLDENVTNISSLYERICLNSENRRSEKSGMNRLVYLLILAAVLIPLLLRSISRIAKLEDKIKENATNNMSKKSGLRGFISHIILVLVLIPLRIRKKK